MLRDTFCSYCGQAFPAGGYPKQCIYCKKWTYLNAPAVGIGLVPINNGLLMIRRNIPPHIGEIALPGGFKEIDETWEQGIARKVYEKTCLAIDANSIRLVGAKTANNGAVLIFGVCKRIWLPEPLIFELDDLAKKLIVANDRIATCFPHHTTMMHWFWDNYADLVA